MICNIFTYHNSSQTYFQKISPRQCLHRTSKTRVTTGLLEQCDVTLFMKILVPGLRGRRNMNTSERAKTGPSHADNDTGLNLAFIVGAPPVLLYPTRAERRTAQAVPPTLPHRQCSSSSVARPLPHRYTRGHTQTGVALGLSVSAGHHRALARHSLLAFPACALAVSVARAGNAKETGRRRGKPSTYRAITAPLRPRRPSPWTLPHATK